MNLNSSIQIHIFYGESGGMYSDSTLKEKGLTTPMYVFGIFSDLQAPIDLDDDIDQFVFLGMPALGCAPLDRANTISISPF